jgi:uncharacterized protein (TIGR02271 family)
MTRSHHLKPDSKGAAMQSNLDPSRLIGRTLIGRGGEKIGTIGQVFLDDQTGVPEFATVRTGLFGSRQSFVPLAQAQMSGDDVSIPYDKDTIKEAPNLDEDTHLSEQEEQQLYEYYGLRYSEGVAGSALPTGERDVRSREDQFAARKDSRTGTDEAMTRSEEQVRVGTERVQRGRARLRKYVVTDEVQQTVPVTREEVRVEREPITSDNVDDAMRGPDISEAEHEVVLTEERPVVQKETVPVERVRLAKDTVTDEAQVTEEVAKEQIETEGVEDVAEKTRRGDMGGRR